jgi:hypothetical protein
VNKVILAGDEIPTTRNWEKIIIIEKKGILLLINQIPFCSPPASKRSISSI